MSDLNQGGRAMTTPDPRAASADAMEAADASTPAAGGKVMKPETRWWP